MNLIDRLAEDMKVAMKNKDKVRLSTIRMVRTAIKNMEIDKKQALSDEDVLALFNRELKQRRDSLQAFEQAGRADLIEGVKEEIHVLEEYLPEQLNDEDLQTIIQEVIAELGATSKADMGKVMGSVLPKVQGRADGKRINAIVQVLLTK